MERKYDCKFFFEDSRSNRKTLFAEALSQAKHGKVLYILSEELNELPELSQDFAGISRHYMKMISFLYAKNLESLLEGISTLPNWQSIPCTIILDNLSEYCNKKHLHNACGLVAFLMDTTRSCEISSKIPCQLLISAPINAFGEEYCNTLKELYSLY